MSNFARKMKRKAIGYTPTPREARMLQALQSAAHVLKQYADERNWTRTPAGVPVWLGEGDGPDLAQMSLGVKAKPKQEEKTTEGP